MQKWEVKILGVTRNFVLGVQNEAGQRLIEFCRDCTSHRKHPFSTTQEMMLHMGITKWSIYLKKQLFLVIFFVAEDGGAVYSQPKQDLELTVA